MELPPARAHVRRAGRPAGWSGGPAGRRVPRRQARLVLVHCVRRTRPRGTRERPRRRPNQSAPCFRARCRTAACPPSRFWEIEDGTVRFGGLTTGRTDLARLLLAEFALAYGNDWFVVPVDLPVGSVCAVDAFAVTDTFGERATGRSVPPTGEGSVWRLFELDAPDGPPRVARAVLPRTGPGRDRRVAPGRGGRVPPRRDGQRRVGRRAHGTREGPGTRSTATRSTSGSSRSPSGSRPTSATRSSSTGWRPTCPTTGSRSCRCGRPGSPRPPASSSSSDDRWCGSSPTARRFAPEPLGRDPHRQRAAAARGGRGPSERHRRGRPTFQLARWTDGRYLLWSGRHRKTGAGEGRSNFRTDVVLPVLGS